MGAPCKINSNQSTRIVIKNYLILRFSYKIHMHRKDLDINDNFKIYEIDNINILPDIFEVLLNVKDNLIHVILETLL